MIVDAHQHFWDPARAEYPWMTDEVAPLRRRFGPADLEPLLREHGVTGTVVVQARQSLDETRDLLAIAASTTSVLGVVGWVDLTADVTAQLAEFEGTSLVGIRHLVHDEPDPEWLLRDDVFDGQVIYRVDVAVTGPSSPVPPGIPRDPGPGQYYASPALAQR